MVNIAIMRAFVNLRQLIDANKDLIRRIDSLEEKYDNKFILVFEAIKELVREENLPRKKIGYRISGSST
jgi:ribosomal protein S17E